MYEFRHLSEIFIKNTEIDPINRFIRKSHLALRCMLSALGIPAWKIRNTKKETVLLEIKQELIIEGDLSANKNTGGRTLQIRIKLWFWNLRWRP